MLMKSEIFQQLESKGLDAELVRRNFSDYMAAGLLPMPVQDPRDRRRVVFPESTVERLIYIRERLGEKATLAEIADEIRNKTELTQEQKRAIHKLLGTELPKGDRYNLSIKVYNTCSIVMICGENNGVYLHLVPRIDLFALPESLCTLAERHISWSEYHRLVLDHGLDLPDKLEQELIRSFHAKEARCDFLEEN